MDRGGARPDPRHAGRHVLGAARSWAIPRHASPRANPDPATALLSAEAVLALAEGDEETARAKSVAAIEEERAPRGVANPFAAQVWWTARLFGEEAAGGAGRPRRRGAPLEDHGWQQALEEPETVIHLRG